MALCCWPYVKNARFTNWIHHHYHNNKIKWALGHRIVKIHNCFRNFYFFLWYFRDLNLAFDLWPKYLQKWHTLFNKYMLQNYNSVNVIILSLDFIVIWFFFSPVSCLQLLSLLSFLLFLFLFEICRACLELMFILIIFLLCRKLCWNNKMMECLGQTISFSKTQLQNLDVWDFCAQCELFEKDFLIFCFGQLIVYIVKQFEKKL